MGIKARSAPKTSALGLFTAKPGRLRATIEQLRAIQQDCSEQLQQTLTLLSSQVDRHFQSSAVLAPYVLPSAQKPDLDKPLLAFVATAQAGQLLTGMTSSIGTLYQRTLDNFKSVTQSKSLSETESLALVTIEALQSLSQAKAALHQLSHKLDQFHNEQHLCRHLDDLVTHYIETPLTALKLALCQYSTTSEQSAIQIESGKINHLLTSVLRELSGALACDNAASKNLPIYGT